MARIEKIEDIETIVCHWSESNLINEELGSNDEGDIEKQVDPVVFDEIIQRAAKHVHGGYDKTSLSVKLKSGLEWCKQSKFCLCRNDTGLMNLLNKGE